MRQLPEQKAPWIVGREPLLEYAADEFLHEITRQQPWRHARYEALLAEFGAFLSADGLAPLAAFTDGRAGAWLRTLHGERRELATRLLKEFRTYLTEWGWLTA